MINKISYLFRIEYLFVISLMILPFLPAFQTLDKIGPQFLFLSLSQLLTSIYLFITSKNKEYKLTIIEICFLGLTFISLISFTASDFLLQSWIEFMRLLVYVIVFFNLTIISKRIENFDQLVFSFLLLFLTFEVVAVLLDFLRMYDFDNPFGRSRELQGLSSNLNVGAFSILIKVPIALYFFNKLKPIFFKLLIWFVLFLSIFSIIVMSSRGAMIGIFLFTFGFLIYIIVKNILNKNVKFTKINTTFLFYLFAVGIAVASHTFLFQNKTDFNVANRLTSFENDSSTSYRIGYYKDALSVMLKNPILGKGIGTWKIHSIEELGDDSSEYEVPYHAHNDFLQYGAETGLLGFLIYILIFLIPLVIIILQIVKKSFKPESFKDFLIVGSIIIFIMDSSINFPKGRPYSMINILLILAVINYIYFSNFKFSLKSTIRTYQFYFILLLIPISFHNYKIILNLKDQVFLFIDYNITKDLSRPLSEIDKIETIYNDLSVSAYPINNQKANYYLFNGLNDKAIDFARKGAKSNPFLFSSENQIGIAYYNKNELDSAYYYCKLAFDKRPNNSAHVTQYQRVLAARKEPIEEFNYIFNIVKKNKIYENEIFWTNHLQAIIYTKNYQNFTEDDKRIANDAEKRFPENKSIKAFNTLINYGVEVVSYSNEVAEDAQKLFNEGEYKKAIALWKKSIEVLPTEEAYYLNIAQAYISMEKPDLALSYLRKVEQQDIKGKDGKFEFLLGLYFLNKGKTNKACEALIYSKNVGFNEAVSVYKLLKCN